MRFSALAILVMTASGCAQQSQQSSQTLTELPPHVAAQAELPDCNASAWQLDGLLWFDSNQPVDSRTSQTVFDSAGRKCVMNFN